MLRLHTRAQNSAGERLRIVLNLKGLRYDYVPVASLSGAEYRALNPQGLMPALETPHGVLTQSLAIVEYLEEQYPDPPVLPADPGDRARARAFALAIAAELHPVTVHRVRKRLAEMHGLDEAATRGWVQHWTAATFGALERTLAARPAALPWCFDDRPTVADAALAPAMANARRFGCDLAAYPLLVAADARCQAHPAFAAARPERQPDFA